MEQVRNPTVPADLIEWLRKQFPPKCIEEREDPISAHRYAAKVELAQRLIRFGTPKGQEGEYSVEIP